MFLQKRSPPAVCCTSQKGWEDDFLIFLLLSGGNSNIFWNFHPEDWGNGIQVDEHIFQMGWFNHQLGSYCSVATISKKKMEETIQTEVPESGLKIDGFQVSIFQI